MTMDLGKDTAGNPIFVDLTRLTNMHIASSSDSAQNTILNNMLLCFLYRSQPSEVNLLLIGPQWDDHNM
ncbi:MAG: hypothetical protein IJU65_03005 [Desulfovibrio sp.]|nr:hypothetical protein [Desulfovibrio sp.]